MSCGILQNDKTRSLFEQINDDHCHCDPCPFKLNSNLLPGFSSQKIEIPVDVLIVAEVPAKRDYEPQKELISKVTMMNDYYREDPPKSFHQQQIKDLLDSLDERGKSWVFTDIIKCFVSQDSENKRKAIQHCFKYLEEQIEVIQPSGILGLGGTVARGLKVKESVHGGDCRIEIGNHKCIYVHSLFPSGRTADKWVKSGGWGQVLKILCDISPSS